MNFEISIGVTTEKKGIIKLVANIKGIYSATIEHSLFMCLNKRGRFFSIKLGRRSFNFTIIGMPSMKQSRQLSSVIMTTKHQKADSSSGTNFKIRATMKLYP